MPLSYPLSREVFFDALPAASVTFDLGENVDLAATRGGEQLAAEAGERLWQGEVALGRLLRAETGRPEVLVDLIRQPGRSFMAYDRRRPAPLADPAGAVLGGATPTIFALNGSDAREMRLAGLPSGYVLSAGDYLSFAYGASPVRQALHRVVDPLVTADTSGQTPFFEVIPAIRPGAAAGAAVQLVRPWCKAVVVFGSVAPMRGTHTVYDGLAFRFVQTLR